MFEREFIQVERALLNDTVWIRYNQIRAMSGAVNDKQEVIAGCSTIYLEGELGFIVNHTQEDILEMVRGKELVH